MPLRRPPAPQSEEHVQAENALSVMMRLVGRGVLDDQQRHGHRGNTDEKERKIHDGLPKLK